MALEINRVTDMMAHLAPGRALIPHVPPSLPEPKGMPPPKEPLHEAEDHPFTADINIRNASPRQVADISLDLYAAGMLTFEDYKMLAFQPELHPDYNRTIGALTGEPAAPDRQRDFVIEWHERLQFELRHHARDSATVKQTARIHELLMAMGRKTRLSA